MFPFGGFFVWGVDPVNTEEFKRKLTAILSADVEGYSRLMGEDEARATAEGVLKIEPKFSLDHLSKRLPYKNHADTDRFIDALRKAGLK